MEANEEFFALYERVERTRVTVGNSASPGTPMRSLVVAFAILGVLLCPYDCAVRAAMGIAPACKGGKGACCAKCQTEKSHSKQQAPCKDDPRKDGHSCLCEGAVFAPTGQQELISLLLLSQLAIAIVSSPSVEISEPVHFTDPEESPPPHLSGREVRIVNLSFLL